MDIANSHHQQHTQVGGDLADLWMPLATVAAGPWKTTSIGAEPGEGHAQVCATARKGHGKGSEAGFDEHMFSHHGSILTTRLRTQLKFN